MNTRVSNSASRLRVAFTLLELLVVVAIIAVLTALLLVGLNGAKESVRKIECISRLKQWSLGFLSYTYDNDDWIPREGSLTNGNVQWDNWNAVAKPRNSDVWYNALSNYVGVPSAASYFGRPDQFYDRASLFHCPSAKIPTSLPSITLFSLAMNSQLIESQNAPTIQFGRIHDTARTVLFLDNLQLEEKRAVQLQAFSYLGQPAAKADRFGALRHGRGGNLAFADGRVQWLPGNRVVETTGPGAGDLIQPEVDVIWNLK